jgi:hypothetical protein
MGGGRGGGHGLFPLEMTAVGWPSAEQQQGIVNEGGGVGSGQVRL